jgi:hypothetical protein
MSPLTFDASSEFSVSGSNTRAAAAEIFSHPDVAAAQPWFVCSVHQ